MYTFTTLLSRIESEVNTLQFTCPPQSLYTPIEYILSLGGKRIRPALTLIACNIYSETVDQAIPTALGFEVFHNFTLLHDDVMDKADMRRKRPTVHKVWNDNTAILSGDAMMIYSYQLIAQTQPEKLKEILDLFTQTALEVCGGQQYDMEFESRNDVTEEEYLEMIRLKTAVLLAACLKAGALIGGATTEDANNLYEFGINIGLAFQLQDDLLDVYGDPETFGKNIGGDILCNKKTFLLIHALDTASATEKQALETWMQCETYDPAEKIAFFTASYNTLRVKELTIDRMNQYYELAMLNLANLSIEAERLTELKAVTAQLMNRTV